MVSQWRDTVSMSMGRPYYNKKYGKRFLLNQHPDELGDSDCEIGHFSRKPCIRFKSTRNLLSRNLPNGKVPS